MTARFVQWARRKLLCIADRRDPDFIIGSADNPYMLRWWVIPRNRLFNIYLHQFLRSDDDRALHDHPWWNLSWILEGTYTEHTIASGGVHHHKRYEQGALRFRAPRTAHRVELTGGPCWTLFITGPVLRTWGFHCPNGWRPWREFVDERDTGKVGRGCGEDIIVAADQSQFNGARP